MKNLLLVVALACPSTAFAGDLRFEIEFAESVRAEPLTGRAFAILSRSDARAPVSQVSPTGVPFFGENVEGLAPGESVLLDGGVLGYPVDSLSDIPAGEYFVQAFFNVYTRFERADGHTVWLPEDHWEGQNWKRKPHNLFSEPRKIQYDGSSLTVSLTCDRKVDPIPFPQDTEWVKRFKIQSKILSDWWGRPMYLGATVLLPKGYAENPDARYPVNYVQGHFSTRAPGGFGRGRGFDRWWKSDGVPRFLMVTLQHPSPYYDDSYAVNSENNGPYGDAILKELIPEVEKRFRAIGQPWARTLSGGSTGGWIALALQVLHPEFFGGAWSLCPDAVDFRAHQIVDVYDDENAYYHDHGWFRTDRPCFRRTNGEIVFTMADENRYELVVGDRSRSGGQWDIWEAAYGPVGEDGYPRRIWDKRTGVIDREVAAYWKENFDLRHILERDWPRLGPLLRGKLNVYVGDMDNYYLNNGVRFLERFLEKATEPAFEGIVEYGPGEGHCWGPSSSELLEAMALFIQSQAPDGADVTSWVY